MTSPHAQARNLLTLALAVVASVTCTLVDVAATAHAAFGTVNGKIAFVSERDGKQGVYTTNADGSRQALLAADGYRASWSPDGTEIAFSRLYSSPSSGGLFTMNADGSGETLLTAYGSDPSWSPDGTKIAYDSSRFQGSAARSSSNVFTSDLEGIFIWVMKADGSGQTRLTGYDWQDAYDPAWSRDGTRISFVWNGFEDEGGTLTMNADGSDLTQVKYPYSAYSPDGRKMLFIDHGKIYTKDRNGSRRKRLTNISARTPLPASDASWSPDGRKIVFVRGRDSYRNAEIYTVNANGSEETRLTRNSVPDESPTWQPLTACLVPRVLGEVPGRARSLLTEAGCRKAHVRRPKTSSGRAHSLRSRGFRLRVIRQSRGAGTSIAPDTWITLKLGWRRAKKQ